MTVDKINDDLLRITIPEIELVVDYDLEIEYFTDEEHREEVSRTLINIVVNAAQELDMYLQRGLHLEIKIDELNQVILDAHFVDELNVNNLLGVAKFFDSLRSKMTKEEAEIVMNETIDKLDLTEDELDEIFMMMSSVSETEPDLEELNKKYEKEKINLLYVIEVDSLDIAITISKLLAPLVSKSSMYKCDGKYCFELVILPDKDKEVITIFSEFCAERKDDLYSSFVQEHGEPIIKEDAVNILSCI